jgi:hypothetical protein
MNLNEMFAALDSNKLATGIANDINAATPENVATVNGLIAHLSATPAVDERAAARVAHENARRAKYGKAKLTAEEARKFEHFSEKNAAALESVCEECTAYEDWFTFNRWIAQGKVVQKGQKGTKITVYIPKEEKLRDGSKKKVLVPKDVACFCRHQVKTLEAAKGRAA